MSIQATDERLALQVEKAVLLWCMRSWLAASECRSDPLPRIHAMLAHLAAAEAVPGLDGFMLALGHGATGTIAIQGVSSPRLSADERLLLDALALAQALRPFEALLLLRGLLSSEAARAALASAETIGTALARAGRFLPAPEVEVGQFALTTRP